jgi:hypothetical protein
MSNKILDSLETRSRDASFQGFRCWDTAQVAEIMHREAAVPDPAVLLATHQPPRVRRVAIAGAGSYGADEMVTQDEVLAGVVAATDQSLIVPIIGASGTGKSHLVLWMRAKLDDDAAPDRKIIYVPKGDTSLGRVIDLILDDRTGSPFDEIRAAVANATRNMTLQEAARRFRDELAIAAGNISATSGGPEKEPLRAHVREHIGRLLDDSVYADRLIGVGGPLTRIVEQARAGGIEEPAEFKSADLDLSLDAIEQQDLSAPARSLIADLYSHKPLHDTAIDVLNEVRDSCLSRVFGVEPMQLVAVMRELRTKLFDDNPRLELLLMVEDFTLLQGIQRDLLEAMIDLPVRDGHQFMCGMKTVLAVTDGFFKSMLASNDTLRTRIAAMGQVYSLDVAYGTGAESLQQDAAVEFVGRYLNAVRVGSAGLAENAPDVPNACDVCRHRDRCHDSFGTSPDAGYGLYPFNDAAIDRVIRGRQAAFNPRDLLGVLATTLTQHAEELGDGRFPSATWEMLSDPRHFGRPRLPTMLLGPQQQIEALPKPVQRRILLTFWGGAPAAVVNLAPGIHEAFDIPLVADLPLAIARRHSTTVAPSARVESDADIERTVLEWRDGGRLDGDTARVIRRVVRDAVLAALDGEAELYSPQLIDDCFPPLQGYVDIERGAGRGTPNPAKFFVTFAASNDNAVLFEGILRSQRSKSWDFDGGFAALTAFLAAVGEAATRLWEFIEVTIAERASDYAAATCLLAASGLAAGQGTPVDHRGLLAAAVSTGTAVGAGAPDQWKALVSQSDQRRAVARIFALQPAHVAKSTADPSGVDGSRLLLALKDFDDVASLNLSESAPPQVATLSKVFKARLEPALEDAIAALRSWASGVDALVGDADTVGTRSKLWTKAVDDAAAHHFLVTAGGLNRDDRLLGLGPVLRAVSDLDDSWDGLDLGRRIAGIAKTPWARLAPLHDQLRAMEATLGRSADKAATQGAGREGASAVEAFLAALEDLDAAIGRDETT